jgi:ferric-dicitrate binding protein FerR (iron transport regulator)
MAKKPDVDDDALSWVIHVKTADDLRESWPALEAWLQEGGEHRAAYLRVEKAWNALEELRRLRPRRGAVDPDLLRKMAQERMSRGRKKRRG